MRAVEDIEQRIQYAFKNPELLQRALTHKSYANEHRVSSHNERMEFLGDAVLNLIVSGYLMKTCPQSNEGELSKLRAAIVSEAALAEIARIIGIGKYLLLGKGEEQTGGRDKDSLLANSLEALIAAVYLDAGTTAAETFILRFFKNLIQRTCSLPLAFDYKTGLQELCQERIKQLPKYKIVSETGPDHLKQFSVELFIKGELFGTGIGKTKKEAEQRAAKEALIRLSEMP
ncbi:MAG: ribonuclease III [Nitrospirota bacterium]